MPLWYILFMACPVLLQLGAGKGAVQSEEEQQLAAVHGKAFVKDLASLNGKRVPASRVLG